MNAEEFLSLKSVRNFKRYGTGSFYFEFEGRGDGH